MANWKNLLLDTAEYMVHWVWLAAIYGSNFKELADRGKMGVGWAGHRWHCGTQGFVFHTHSVQDLSKTQTTCNMSCSHKEKHTKVDASKSLYRVAAQIMLRVPRMTPRRLRGGV